MWPLTPFVVASCLLSGPSPGPSGDGLVYAKADFYKLNNIRDHQARAGDGEAEEEECDGFAENARALTGIIHQVFLELPMVEELRKNQESHCSRQIRIIEETQKRVRDTMMRVVLVGSFSAGKSTLVNALLGRDDYQDTAPWACTSAISTIKYNTTEQDSCLRWNRETHEEGSEKSSDRSCVMRERSVNAEFLKYLKFVTLTDTPGYDPGSNDMDDVTTDNHIPLADYALFLTAADHAMSKSDVKYLKRIALSTRRVVIVVTKLGVIRQRDVDELRSRVIRTVNSTGFRFPVFMIDSQWAIEAQRAAKRGKDDDDAEARQKYSASKLGALVAHLKNQFKSCKCRSQMKGESLVDTLRLMMRHAKFKLKVVECMLTHQRDWRQKQDVHWKAIMDKLKLENRPGKKPTKELCNEWKRKILDDVDLADFEEENEEGDDAHAANSYVANLFDKLEERILDHVHSLVLETKKDVRKLVESVRSRDRVKKALPIEVQHAITEAGFEGDLDAVAQELVDAFLAKEDKHVEAVLNVETQLSRELETWKRNMRQRVGRAREQVEDAFPKTVKRIIDHQRTFKMSRDNSLLISSATWAVGSATLISVGMPALGGLGLLALTPMASKDVRAAGRHMSQQLHKLIMDDPNSKLKQEIGSVIDGSGESVDRALKEVLRKSLKDFRRMHRKIRSKFEQMRKTIRAQMEISQERIERSENELREIISHVRSMGCPRSVQQG
mmetsp:Transcript_19993/g.38560  ORF Transcript_19993/g.38560 Transcript_19993/m.38560 type:complete len:726 (-) Transcript_19993:227-2404(-)